MRRLSLLCLGLCLCWAGTVAAAEQWRVAVAEVPGLAEADGTGPLLDLVRAMDQQLPDIDFELQIIPFARTFHLLQNGQCEFQVPFLGNLPRLPAGLRYGSGLLWEVRFGLFTRRANSLSVAQLLDPAHALSSERLAASGLDAGQQAQLMPLLGHSWRVDELQEQLAAPTVTPALRSLAFPYKVETDRAHAPWLGFPALSGNSIEASLQKLVRGRIDGYVFAVNETEHEIDRLGLREQLRAQDFGLYPVRWLVPDTPRGSHVDKRLTEALRKLQAQPGFQRLQAPLNKPSRDWKPWP
ncbi:MULTISPECIES: hypothetical protein [unclassified Pseudomonas]|uniref:hypothetical protein n=1 Tax=unclassified Pseudomonas TaxID=196821 RepID=UPI000EA8DC6F|nr:MULTISPECIES: hypothetical protein [unclassified Pseudomonas]AYF88994.1 hypothetical protein D6Z43_18280 [Pseudomonas sp. DY-1]MDH4653189.1 hypothetical protein [Pseudomonas sp. BN606]MRK21089.1 hypothetical protein [Pseudomonas sp. JG-B]